MLKLKHQVITVDNRSPNFTTVVCETEGQMRRFRGKHIICAVPLAVSRLITFERLSPAKKLIIDNQLRTNSNKSFMITKKPFWRRDSQGKPMANGDSLLSKEYLANMSHDISPTDESCGIIVFFHNGRRLDAWDTTFGQEDYEKKRQYFIDLMSKMFGVSPKDQKKHFEDCFYYECSYMSDQFIRSGFQSLTRPGTFNEVLEIGDSLNALYRDENGITFIGSEYSLQFASYM
jgi:monoamine oxidase